MSGHGFLNLPLVPLEATQQKRYRITLDLTIDDNPEFWDFEDLLEIEETEKITLFTNKNNKLVSSIENKEELLSIIDSLNIEIEVKTSDKCEANYKLVFEKISSDIEMLVYCQNNPYYVEVEQSLNAGKSILSVVEKILTNMEFPGMPQ